MSDNIRCRCKPYSPCPLHKEKDDSRLTTAVELLREARKCLPDYIRTTMQAKWLEETNTFLASLDKDKEQKP